MRCTAALFPYREKHWTFCFNAPSSFCLWFSWLGLPCLAVPCAAFLISCVSHPARLLGSSVSTLGSMLNLGWSLPSMLCIPPRIPITTSLHCNPRSLAMARVHRMNKAMARSLAKRRADHAHRRLKQLRLILPELPPDVLERCNLRQLSFTIRRCGGPCQLPLQSADQTTQASNDNDLQLSSASLPILLCSPSPRLLGES